MSDCIRVLYVDGDAAYREAGADFLRGTDEGFEVETAASVKHGVAMLDDEPVDCVVSADDVSDGTGLEFLESVRQENPNIPFVLFAGSGSEELASEAVSAGVTAYLPKGTGSDQYSALAESIADAAGVDAPHTAADGHGHQLEQILRTVPGCVVQLDTDGRFVYANDRAEEVLGLDRSAVTERRYNDPEWEIRDLAGYPIPDEELPFRRVLDSGESLFGFEHEIRWPDGDRKILSVNGAPLFDESGSVDSVVFSLTDVTEQKARERRLEQYHEHTGRLINAIDDIFFVEDANGTFVRWNDTFAEVTGYDDEELTSMNGLDLVPRAHRDRTSERISEVFDNGHARLEAPLRTKNGEVIPYEFVADRVENPDGEPQLVGVGRDITEQKQRKQELERYEQIVDHLDDIATVISPAGIITYVSPAVERVLGYEPDELIGQNGFGYQPPETSEAVAEAIETVAESPDEPVTVQTKFRRADGSFCWIESTMRNRLEDDVIEGILVSSRDVTDRVDQGNQIRQRNHQLDRLHEATRELLGAETPQQVATMASEAAVEILDIPLNGIHFHDEDIDGLKPAAVSQGSRELLEDVPVIDDGIAWDVYDSGEPQICEDLQKSDEAFNPETSIRSEVILPLGDHGVFILSSSEADTFEESDVEFAQILAANTESALDRITREQQLRRRESELEQQNERLEEFASVVSHDLRNPLNVAQGRLDLAQRQCDSEHHHFVADALDRMETLIDDLLTLSRHGKTIANQEPVDLETVAQDCWENVNAPEATRLVECETTVLADRSRLRQLFENLFRNAVDHGREDVTVTVGDLDDGFYVVDDGPGIPEDDRDEVFEVGHTTSDDGTGFGLAIVGRVVEAHGWDVTIEPSDDGGARFEITGVEHRE